MLYGDEIGFLGNDNCPILQANKQEIVFGTRHRHIRRLNCENCPLSLCFADMPEEKRISLFIKEINATIEELGALKDYINKVYLHKESLFNHTQKE